jgi:AmmeMemoRadiSam system protein B
MIVRKRRLPPPWYPQIPERIRAFIGEALQNGTEKGVEEPAIAAVAPHAGWSYSGVLAVKAVSALNSGADTVVVIGGHLPVGMRPLFAEEEAVETPLGNIPIDGEFRDMLRKELGGGPDRYQDNTVEVQLPLVRHFFPQAKILWLRLPGEIGALAAGKEIARIGVLLRRHTVVLGSTDLTHYGDHYDFTPRGRGREALNWVKEVNDAAFITSVLEGNPRRILERAGRDRSACSVGAVLGALGFAQALGADRNGLLAYKTSLDGVDPEPGRPEAEDDIGSFVGYGAFAWYKDL